MMPERLLLSAVLILTGCNRPEPLPAPSAAELRAMAPPATVTVVVQPANPARRIIQLDDLHWVSREDFTADLQTMNPGLTEDDIGKAYGELMKRVDNVQAEQVVLLKAMAQLDGILMVHWEGLTAANCADSTSMVATVKGFGPGMPIGHSTVDMMLRKEIADDLRRIGAAGQLLADGVLTEVLPADDADALEAADPVQDDGTVEIDQAAQERREAAIVRNLLTDGRRVAVVVLGADHDLSEHLPADCEYIRVTVPAVND